MDVHRQKGAQWSLRGFELITLGTGFTICSVLTQVCDIFSTWASLALEGKSASWAWCPSTNSSSPRATFLPRASKHLQPHPLANLGSSDMNGYAKGPVQPWQKMTATHQPDFYQRTVLVATIKWVRDALQLGGQLALLCYVPGYIITNTRYLV